MKKETLWRGIALLAAFVGIIVFCVGNWTSWIAPAGLTPMAWISAMSLVIAAFAGAFWWSNKMYDLSAGCAFFALEGMVLGAIGFGLWITDSFNPDFVGEMFQHPFAGVLCVGLLMMLGITAIQAREAFKDNDFFVGWFYVIGALFMFTTALAIGGAAWIIPIGTWWTNAFAYATLGCMALMTAMFAWVIAAKK